jgi:hypothetical protein
MVDFAEFKKFFMFNLIGSLIVASLVAVVSVLIGEFNQTAQRSLWTLSMVIVHSFISLAFIWDDKKQDTFETFSFFSNVIFLTSIFGIWSIITPESVGNLYQTYFVVAFAALHADILSKALHKETYLDVIVYVNYIFILIVVSLIQPIIWELKSFMSYDLFYRVLGAMAIIDGTLTILAIIFYKLYMKKHPKIESPLENNLQGTGEKSKRKLSIWVWILIIYLFFQFIFPWFFWIF